MNSFFLTDGISKIFAGGMSAGSIIFSIIILIAVIYAQFIIFRKAGEPGIAAIIPVYNLYTLAKIVFGNGWIFLISLIPAINSLFFLYMIFKLGKSFGKGTGFCLGLIFFSPIFMMILAFSDAQYIGPNN